MSKKRPPSSEQLKREQPDPIEGDRPWPLVTWIVLMLMVAWATAYFAVMAPDGQLKGGDMRVLKPAETPKTEAVNGQAQKDRVTEMSLDEKMAQGKQVYESVCMACHQQSGQGLSPAFPPLTGSQWVTGSLQVPVKIILHGLKGPINVKGESYNGVMPAFGNQLSDKEISSVVTYIRRSWGNSASEVSIKEVQTIREKNSERSSSWTAGELSP